MNRSSHWFAVAAFSTIALVSITTEFGDVGFEGDITDQKRETKWAVSAISVALGLSGLAVFANLLLKDKFVDTPMEGGMALLTCGFWASVLPAIMDPSNELATEVFPDDVGGFIVDHILIRNNNLYFFSWGAFIMSFYVLFGYLKKGVELSGAQVFSWAGLAMTSFIVMVSSVRQYDEWNCDSDNNSPDDQCKRVKLGISIGLISGVIGGVWAFLGRWMKGKFADMLDTFLSWFLFVVWIFGIIYITFGGEKAPARFLGNLYFFTWASFSLSVFMAMKSLTACMGEKDEEEEEPTAAAQSAEPKAEMSEVEGKAMKEPAEADKDEAVPQDEEVAA